MTSKPAALAPAVQGEQTDEPGMSVGKRILFSLVTLLLVVLAVEGAARLIWWRIAAANFNAENSVNFMKEAHPIYGYWLKPGFAQGGAVVNPQGFAQRDSVPLERTPGTLRVAALGESTTHGHDVDQGNYPAYLRRRLEASAPGHRHVEMINGGVSGWISDQVALRAENEIAAFRPDIVVLYVGWNDFQAYDPYGGVPMISKFEDQGGSELHQTAASALKSVALLSALYQKVRWQLSSQVARITSAAPPPEKLYRFYLSNLARTVTAFRNANPNVRICLSTLVGRWPLDAEADFATQYGRTWWMTKHQLTRQDAAEHLRHLNALIRRYAADHGLILVDAAAAFDTLDRGQLQWDFAHMSFEGYELLAETMYEALRQAGAIDGAPSARRAELVAKYRLANAPPS